MSEEATGRTPYRGFAGKPAKSPQSAGEMVERVARALREGGSYEDMARAAIAAMREPTKEMGAAAGGKAFEVNPGRELGHSLGVALDSLSIYRAMIDAALHTPTHTTGDE